MRIRFDLIVLFAISALLAGCGPQGGPIAPPPPPDAPGAVEGPNRTWKDGRKVGDAVPKAHRALN